MPLPPLFVGRLRVPAVAAPMFLVSGPDLVVEACRAGVVGTFPALNERTSIGFEAWLATIEQRLARAEDAGERPAPYGVNLIVHKTNPRLDADLALCVKHRVPVVITSLGCNAGVISAVQGYGGIVFHDVINRECAEKAAARGVDGIVCVSAGAGGPAGTINPFALVTEVRRVFDGTILLGSCINTGAQIAAARLMGADLAYRHAVRRNARIAGYRCVQGDAARVGIKRRDLHIIDFRYQREFPDPEPDQCRRRSP
jgi:nitronate monooxygenase